MIINIPIQVDEQAIEEKATQEYKHEVDKMLVDRIEKVLVNEVGWSSWARYNDKTSAEEGMKALIHRTVERYVDEYMENHTDEILDKAVDKLEKRLMNRKRIKEVGENV